ncbi:MAG: hypothetical protein JO314_08405 [Acidobacteria bacterium]|nr:hypothetical protein [Acidobacteriota bacterium]
MKQCPSCGTTYTDSTLIYCLADGTPLNAVDVDQPTVVRKVGGDPVAQAPIRIDLATAPPPGDQSPSAEKTRSGGGLKALVVGLVIVLILLLIALIAIIGAYMFVAKGPTNTGGSHSPTPSPTADSRDQEIANLQRQLEDQKNRPSATPVATPNLSSVAMNTVAQVNSPGDGFLALRTLPSATAGDRIAKIPHGATISIGSCGPIEHAAHPGRWCQARYNGYTGYIYDYYVIY